MTMSKHNKTCRIEALSPQYVLIVSFCPDVRQVPIIATENGGHTLDEGSGGAGGAAGGWRSPFMSRNTEDGADAAGGLLSISSSESDRTMTSGAACGRACVAEAAAAAAARSSAPSDSSSSLLSSSPAVRGTFILQEFSFHTHLKRPSTGGRFAHSMVSAPSCHFLSHLPGEGAVDDEHCWNANVCQM